MHENGRWRSASQDSDGRFPVHEMKNRPTASGRTHKPTSHTSPPLSNTNTHIDTDTSPTVSLCCRQEESCLTVMTLSRLPFVGNHQAHALINKDEPPLGPPTVSVLPRLLVYGGPRVPSADRRTCQYGPSRLDEVIEDSRRHVH